MEKTTLTKLMSGSCRSILQTGKSSLFGFVAFFGIMLMGLNQVQAQGCSIACTNINVNIGDGCIASIHPGMMITGTSGNCGILEDWVIRISATMNGPVIYTGTFASPAEVDGEEYLNKTLVGEVTDNLTGARCWAFILIEDKTPPVINCDDITIECDEMLMYQPEVSDNCEVASIVMINETRRNANCTQRNGIAVVNNGFGGGTNWEAIGAGATNMQNAAFDDIFGNGNWNLFNYGVSAASIFNEDYGFVYLDGGNLNANALSNFLNLNRNLIEKWVAFGGALFLNAAPNQGGNIDFGFGGVTLVYGPNLSNIGNVVDPTHPIFNGPSIPASGNFTGNRFSHAIICPPGMIATPLIRDGINRDLLVEMDYGQGIVFFGGMTTPNAHGPAPNADNMRRNIYSYLYENRNEFAKGITSVVNRTYVAIDHVGLRDTCTVQISVRRPDLEDVDMPAEDIELSCSGNFALDSNGNPHPSVTGYPTYNGVALNPAQSSLYCNLFVGYTDINLPGLCLGERKVMRRWTVSEWYCGADFDLEGVQIILLKDNEAPVINCGPTLEVSTGFYTCASTINIPRPAVTDNCSPESAIIVDLMFRDTFIHNFQGGNISGFEVGVNVITFRAYDDCGNSSNCTRTVIVTDEVPPIAICKTYTTASLGIDGTAQVPWSSFDDGSYDNCGIEKIEVRRMSSHPCDPVPVFRAYVPVCCEDVGTQVIVILRVTDTSDNTNECMVELEVQDKLPAFIVGPPDITVQCGFDLSDLSIFGGIANYTKGETRNPIIIDGVNWGLDGYAYDNCQVMIFMNESIDLTSCGAGTVTRTFNAVGAGNQTVATWTQTITVENNVSYLPESIKWPCDLVVFDLCVNDPATELAPSVLEIYNGTGVTCNQGLPAFYDRPRYADDECTQVGVSYKDHVFEIQDSACYKILREWKIIDWCAMEQNPGLPLEYYIYSDIQVIKIMNTVAPEIVCPANQTVCSYQEVCSTGEVLTLTASATDDCTREEDLFWRWEYFQNNGIQVTASGNSKTLTRSFPVGTHRVRFLVEDKCGNTNACTTMVTIEDCKKPTPICHHLTTDLMITGMVRINAKVFNAGSYDNCTQPQNLQYRIEVQPFAVPAPNVPPLGADTAYVFTCDDLGLNFVRIWVGDEDGNWDFCETTLIVQNNAGADCDDNIGGIIAGLISTEGEEKVEKVDVKLEGQQSGSYMTGNEGMFEFTNIARGTSFAVRPSRVDEARNGLSTTDLLLIQRHILGLEDLDSPYKLLAADVNQSGAITGADLVEIRKVILNNSEKFSSGPSWKFVKKDYNFFDGKNPWSENYPQEMMVLNFNGNVPMLEFVGIKMGDVNNSVRANSSLQGLSGRNANALAFEVEDIRMKAGNEYRVTFRSGSFRSIYGYQFTMNFNASAMSLTGIEAGVVGVSEENFGVSRLGEGYLTTSWHAVDGMSAGSEDELFTLVFRANGDALLSEVLSVSSEITEAEAYEDLHAQPLDVRLVFLGKQAELAGSEFELFQNRPNPFNAETIISFNLPENGNASITVYDVTGKVVKQVAGEFVKGYNEVRVQASELGTSAGVLYYELKTDQATATKKMILIN